MHDKLAALTFVVVIIYCAVEVAFIGQPLDRLSYLLLAVPAQLVDHLADTDAFVATAYGAEGTEHLQNNSNRRARE